MSFLDTLNGPISDAFYFVDDYFWGIAFAFLIGLGIVFTVKLKFMQILRIKHTSALALSGIQEGSTTKQISSFEAFCLGMGARIGVGNIAGVATAIVLGGPGAVFWMWIFAIIGSASAFMESTLAQIYKERKSDGQYYGGPAYYALKGLKSRKLGVLAAILLVLTFGLGFVGVQACNASGALCGAFEFDNNRIFFALIIAIIAAVLIFKGLKMVAVFSAKIVPFMAVAWIIFSLIAIALNISGVVNAFSMIFQYAFNWNGVFGAGIGIIIVTGLKRGVFSNEAGLGSVANLAATADVPHPVKQGKIQSFGVLVDTLIVCTLTAIVVLSYGSYNDILAFDAMGAPLVQNIVASTAIGSAAKYIIAIFMFLFAFTSLIGYYTMSEANARFIKDDKNTIFIVKIVVIIMAFAAACVADVKIIDAFSDTFMALMASVNMIIIALLSRKVFEAYADYRLQKKNGIEEPVFHRETLSDSTGVTEWE